MSDVSALSAIDLKWREAVSRFANTGQAEAEFLAALDTDERLQRAVDFAIRQQADSLDEVTTKLRADIRLATVSVSERLAETLQNAVALNAKERRDAIEQTAAALRGMGSKRMGEVAELVASLSARMTS